MEINQKAQLNAEQRFEQLVIREKLLKRLVGAMKELRNSGFSPDNNLKYTIVGLIEEFEDQEP